MFSLQFFWKAPISRRGFRLDGGAWRFPGKENPFTRSRLKGILGGKGGRPRGCSGLHVIEREAAAACGRVELPLFPIQERERVFRISRGKSLERGSFRRKGEGAGEVLPIKAKPNGIYSEGGAGKKKRKEGTGFIRSSGLWTKEENPRHQSSAIGKKGALCPGEEKGRKGEQGDLYS